MWEYLRSIRFFFLIAALLVVFAGLASLIPQNIGEEAYTARYGVTTSGFILAIGLDRFYRSPLFFILGGLLELNLLACTIPRLARRLRHRQTRLFSFAPDVIHLGLAVLIVGGVVTFAFRDEAEFTGTVGQTFSHAGVTVVATGARELVDDEGVVLSWEIDLRHDGQTRTVAINDPTGIGDYRAYFRHFQERAIAELRFSMADAEALTLRAGEGLQARDGTVLTFEGLAEDGDGLFRVDYPDEETERLKAEAGAEIFDLIFRPAGVETVVGFRLARDPGRPVLLAGFIVLAVGLGMFAAQKLLDRKDL